MQIPIRMPATGLEIKDWVWYNMTHETKYTNTANGLKKVFNLADDKKYIIRKDVGEINIVEDK